MRLPDRRLRLAAFGEGATAIAAWTAWWDERNATPIDPVERRLLPAVYRSLRSADIADVEIPAVVKEATRSFWIRTRLLLRDAAGAARTFQEHGIPVMLLKGAALVASGCWDARDRPMSDVDLLVRPEEAVYAARLLQETGWTTETSVDERLVEVRHAANFRRADSQCDLHWWALWDSRDADGDERFRERSELAALDGVEVRILSPADQLLHLIVHGTRAYDRASVRWIGDALAVIRNGRVQWDAFVAEARARRLSHPCGAALALLRSDYGADVPSAVIQELSGDPVSRRQRRLYVADPDAPTGISSVAFLTSMVALARRERNAAWFVSELQYVLKTPNVLRLPAALLRRAARIIQRERSKP